MKHRIWLQVALILLLATPIMAQQKDQPWYRSDLTFYYEPLRDPQFVPAAKADFLQDEDRVLGVSQNGVSKAYRMAILRVHHILHDQLGTLPILVTW